MVYVCADIFPKRYLKELKLKQKTKQNSWELYTANAYITSYLKWINTSNLSSKLQNIELKHHFVVNV